MADYKRDSERFRRLFKEARNTADKLHQRYTEGAQLTGYIGKKGSGQAKQLKWLQ